MGAYRQLSRGNRKTEKLGGCKGTLRWGFRERTVALRVRCTLGGSDLSDHIRSSSRTNGSKTFIAQF